MGPAAARSSGRAERTAWLLDGDLGAHAVAPHHPFEDLEALVRLGAEGTDLAEERLDTDFVLQVHAVIGLGCRSILHRLPILTHDDERALQRDEDGESEVVELIWVLVERRGQILV